MPILPVLIRSRFQQVESCIWLIDRIPDSESEELLQNFRSNQAPKSQILHKIDFLDSDSSRIFFKTKSRQKSGKTKF